MNDKKEDLKTKLTPEEYYVTQNQGTEPAFSGKYDGVKTPGTYHCVVCDTSSLALKLSTIPDQAGQVSGSRPQHPVLIQRKMFLQE